MTALPEYVLAYFKGEKYEMIIILIISVTFIVFSLWSIIFTKDGFLKGTSIPLIILSLLLSGVALGLIFITSKGFYRGIAIGLMVMALVGFVIDHYSETRAKIYYQKMSE